MKLRSRRPKPSFPEDVSDNEAPKASSGKTIDRSTFLELIKKYPELYDVNHPNFNEKKSLDNIWSEMSSQTGIFGSFFKCFF